MDRHATAVPYEGSETLPDLHGSSVSALSVIK